MQSTDLRLGFLLDGDASDEEAAALGFARDIVADAETVPLASVAADETALAEYDALWWHAHEPVRDPATVADCADRIRSFVADGGGLFCSSRALAQVSALGIDPVPPDATGTEAVTDPVGPLWKAVYAGHPAVDGLDDLRHHIRPAGSEGPYARYENVLPQRGDVLAGTYRGADEVPTEIPVVQWRIGSGTVFGVGVGMEFAQHDDVTTEATREQFAANVFRWLSGASDYETALATGRPKAGAEFARYRDALGFGPHRPRYHVSPPANWLNDPNGLIHHDGRYHLFYQYNPAGPHHDTVHWGHAVSDDLISWEDRPVAMRPDPSGPDRDGCWSGCAVAVEERADGSVVPAGSHATDPVDDAAADAVYALYTGGRDGWQLPCLASATDADLTAFEPVDENPVIDEPPAALDLLSTPGEPAHFRDHCLLYQDDRWIQLVGAGLQDLGGVVVAYTSEDLREWRYEGPALVTDDVDPGVVWECPELLRFEGGDLLHVSDYGHVRYVVGEFDPDAISFHVTGRGTLDPGAFYAPQSLTTPDGREIMIGWLREERTIARQWDAGWSGAMSLPREIEVVDGDLRQRPAREVTQLRERRLADRHVTLDDDAERLNVSGTALEIDAVVDPSEAVEAGIVLRATPDGAECTTIRVRDDEVVVDRAESSRDRETHDDAVRVDVAGLETPFDLRVFLDESVLELFVNARRAAATRIYPTRDDATEVGLYAGSGGGEFDIDVWRMESAWPTEIDRIAAVTTDVAGPEPASATPEPMTRKGDAAGSGSMRSSANNERGLGTDPDANSNP
ncbi:hypothetical protein JCM18237_13980 [Halorubrum luteum]